MTIDSKVPIEMKGTYVERRKSELLELDKAIENNDFNFMEKIGHQIKGNAQSFGFDQLSPIAVALEKAAKSKDITEAKRVIQQFHEVLKSIYIS